MVLLQCFAPYLLEKGIRYLQSLLHNNFRKYETLFVAEYLFLRKKGLQYMFW